MYSIIARLLTSSTTPLRGTMHLLNGTLDAVTMFSQSSVGCGGHLLSPPANLNKPDQINARWWLCIHWASAHVHKCMYNFSTATPQARKAWKLSGNKCAVSINMSKGFHSLFAVWSRALTQQVSSSNCCRSLVKCPTPTLSFSCQHYNDGAERRRERNDGMVEKTKQRGV